MAYNFTGKELDESTGFYYFGARYFDPRANIWISPDPILADYAAGQVNGGVYSPANLGLYSYSYQNPVNMVDPDGRAVETAWDAFNVGLGLGSLAYNVRSGNWGWAAVDVAALAYDAFATAVPVLPGGASSVAKAGRVGSVVGSAAAAGTAVRAAPKETRLFRVIRPDENPKMGLAAKNPNATYTVEGHVLHGSRPNFESQYISTTTDISVAKKWAAKSGNRIVEIDPSGVTGNIIDLSTSTGRNANLRGNTAKSFAEASSEVLIEGSVPASAVRLLE